MYGLLAARQTLEDGSASGIGQGLEDIVSRVSHKQTITKWLWFVNCKIVLPRRGADAAMVNAGLKSVQG